jgi:hypothetical protein
MSQDDMAARARIRETQEIEKADEAIIELLSREVHHAFEAVVNRMAESTAIKNKDHSREKVFAKTCKIFNGPLKAYGLICRAEMVNRNLHIVVGMDETKAV